jgi:hypothetical protein
MNNTNISATDITDHLAEYDHRAKIAQETPCGVDGCDGEFHDPFAPSEEWNHYVRRKEFDNGIVQASVALMSDGKSVGNIHFGGDGEMSAVELREAADLYEGFPAWLRSMADTIDERNGIKA